MAIDRHLLIAHVGRKQRNIFFHYLPDNARSIGTFSRHIHIIISLFLRYHHNATGNGTMATDRIGYSETK